ncbi:hypothetical protein Tco_1436144, partial [Tanacetum coccineum]
MNREELDEGSGTMFKPWLSQQATNQFRADKRRICGGALLLPFEEEQKNLEKNQHV